MQAATPSNSIAQSTAPSSEPAEARQFDFWLGDWALSWGNGATGTNQITAILDGHVIRENFVTAHR